MLGNSSFCVYKMCCSCFSLIQKNNSQEITYGRKDFSVLKFVGFIPSWQRRHEDSIRLVTFYQLSRSRQQTRRVFWLSNFKVLVPVTYVLNLQLLKNLYFFSPRTKAGDKVVPAFYFWTTNHLTNHDTGTYY